MLYKTLPGDFEFEVGTWGDDVWYVQLPHQCDAWEIAREASRDEAIANLEKFLAEGQAALELLRSGQPDEFEAGEDD